MLVRSFFVLFAIILSSLAVSALAAQEEQASRVRWSVADSYQTRFNELMNLSEGPARVGQVEQPITLQRDAGRLTFNEGAIYLLPPVGGRTVAAVFSGEGRFVFVPRGEVERGQLQRVHEQDSLDLEIQWALLLFTDETAAELQAAIEFADGVVSSRARRRVRSAFEYVSDRDSEYFEVDIMRALLNGIANETFYAHITPRRGRDLMLMINPWAVEGTKLLRSEGDGESTLVCQFTSERGTASTAAGDRVGDATIRRYSIESWLPRTAAGNINFSAAVEMEIVAEQETGPWLAFTLYSELEVDSAFWSDGQPVQVFKGEDNPTVWIRAEHRLDAGESVTVKLYYHGDLIDRYGEFFFIRSGSVWYPRSLSVRSHATFDLVYHSPSSYLFASAGELVESTTEGNIVTSRWRSPSPMRNVGFNLGIFEEYKMEEEEAPPVTVLWADRTHRNLARIFITDRNMQEQVAADISNSLGFFTRFYGPTEIERFYATEIPFAHGEAFPGLVHLSASTFIDTDDEGYNEVFRAHEVAHQWWGIGVDFDSYHDQWLSEGFATFSGLWYLQTVRNDDDRYFDMLGRWRRDLMRTRGSPDDPDRGGPPIWLGYRTGIGGQPGGYNLIVYQKGAWVLHMLRIMMLDLQTMNEDAFTNMMSDFYASYRGGTASTGDFQRVVEDHIGVPMDWFFDQWVRSNYIPTYKVSWNSEPAENGRYRLRVRVRQENVPPDFRMYVPLSVDFGNNRFAKLRVEVTGADSEIPMPLMPLEPRDVLFNELEGVLAEVDMERWRD